MTYAVSWAVTPEGLCRGMYRVATLRDLYLTPYRDPISPIVFVSDLTLPLPSPAAAAVMEVDSAASSAGCEGDSCPSASSTGDSGGGTDTVPCLSAVLLCCSLGLLYVGSLYVWRSGFSRDHPATIRRRFVSVLLVSLVSPLFPHLYLQHGAGSGTPLAAHSLWEVMGLRWAGLLPGAAAALPADGGAVPRAARAAVPRRPLESLPRAHVLVAESA